MADSAWSDPFPAKRSPTSRFAILEAPSILGLFPKRVENLPEALLEAGLAEELQARRAARIVPPHYNARRNEKTGLLNGDAIASYSILLATAVEHVMVKGDVPVVLGGDCSILLGCLLGLRRSDRFGLLFLDAHADFYQPGRGAEWRRSIDGTRSGYRTWAWSSFQSRRSETAGFGIATWYSWAAGTWLKPTGTQDSASRIPG